MSVVHMMDTEAARRRGHADTALPELAIRCYLDRLDLQVKVVATQSRGGRHVVEVEPVGPLLLQGLRHLKFLYLRQGDGEALVGGCDCQQEHVHDGTSVIRNRADLWNALEHHRAHRQNCRKFYWHMRPPAVVISLLQSA